MPVTMRRLQRAERGEANPSLRVTLRRIVSICVVYVSSNNAGSMRCQYDNRLAAELTMMIFARDSIRVSMPS